MSLRKTDEENKTWFRVERLFSVGNEWYVATREGKDIGPFKTRLAAERSIERYLINLKDTRISGLNTNKIARDGVWATNYYL